MSQAVQNVTRVLWPFACILLGFVCVQAILFMRHALSFNKKYNLYPIWWGEIPMVLETFFDTYDFSGATIIPFCTHEGSGESGTTASIQEREPNATVLDAFAMRGGSVGTDDSKAEIENWLSGLNLN